MSRDDYALGRQTLEELERETEIRLMCQNPGLIPDGWEPPPPCAHDWIDITMMGSPRRQEMCARCGQYRLGPV